MAVRHIVLRHLALVDLLLLAEEIHREFLLQERVAFIFSFVKILSTTEARHTGLPFGGADTFVGEIGGDSRGGFAVKEKAVNQLHHHRFLRDDFRQAVRAFPVSEEPFIGQSSALYNVSLSMTQGLPSTWKVYGREGYSSHNSNKSSTGSCVKCLSWFRLARFRFRL